MDPSANLNTPTDNSTAAVQSAVKGIPGALIVAGIPVVSLQFLVASIRPIFAPFGINVDRLLEQPTQQAGDEGEAAHKCPICLGAYVQPTAIKVCGHVYCASCLARAVRKPKKCPLCSTNFTKRQLLRIYLN